jgi:tRNA uridine 5-carboxymethylaminomethyl modification enzyme
MLIGGHYDVIVVGGGHAGAEAAAAATRVGAKTLMITPDLLRIGQMSCNPAIGGIAKGVVAREVDALGGIMGRATDASRIQFRMLNRSKGPAVWSPRAQCDRELYPRSVQCALEELEGLTIHQEMVSGLLMTSGKMVGVRTQQGLEFFAEAVIVTAGTFLRGKIHIGGETGVGAGRIGEPPSIALANELENRGLEVARFKTGTPPRIDGRTVDYNQIERQDGDPEDFRFSSYTKECVPEQRPCWITWTGKELLRVVKENINRSAVFGGEISGLGPRYCPSIEDKVVRFPDNPRHQVFLEPEGLETTELYVNGLSTSLPSEIQVELIHTIPGLERAEVTKTGYAIEYDYFPPHQLNHTLEVKAIPGLYFAGQINGTTGYEEAAGQGLMAGANAGLKALGRKPFILERDQAYIGVLIDDLITKGVDEPYRLFTSRAEFRLMLRQDNTVRRLGPIACSVGLLTKGQKVAMNNLVDREKQIQKWFVETTIKPSAVNPILIELGTPPIKQAVRVVDLLRRPEVPAKDLAIAGRAPFDPDVSWNTLAAVEIELKYEGYVRRESERAAKLREQATFELNGSIPYKTFLNISYEAREKLSKIRPTSLAQASRIPGISPADLQNLILEVRRWRREGLVTPVVE